MPHLSLSLYLSFNGNSKKALSARENKKLSHFFLKQKRATKKTWRKRKYRLWCLPKRAQSNNETHFRIGVCSGGGFRADCTLQRRSWSAHNHWIVAYWVEPSTQSQILFGVVYLHTNDSVESSRVVLMMTMKRRNQHKLEIRVHIPIDFFPFALETVVISGIKAIFIIHHSASSYRNPKSEQKNSIRVELACLSHAHDIGSDGGRDECTILSTLRSIIVEIN